MTPNAGGGSEKTLKTKTEKNTFFFKYDNRQSRQTYRNEYPCEVKTILFVLSTVRLFFLLAVDSGEKSNVTNTCKSDK